MGLGFDLGLGLGGSGHREDAPYVPPEPPDPSGDFPNKDAGSYDMALYVEDEALVTESYDGGTDTVTPMANDYVGIAGDFNGSSDYVTVPANGANAVMAEGDSTTELVDNGDFVNWTTDDPDDWSIPFAEDAGAYVTEVSEACRMVSDGDAMAIRQDQASVDGLFRFEMDIDTVVDGDIRMAKDDSSPHIYWGTTGHKVYPYKSDSLKGPYLIRQAGTTDITFDNVSLMALTTYWEIDGSDINVGKLGTDYSAGQVSWFLTYDADQLTIAQLNAIRANPGLALGYADTVCVLWVWDSAAVNYVSAHEEGSCSNTGVGNSTLVTMDPISAIYKANLVGVYYNDLGEYVDLGNPAGLQIGDEDQTIVIATNLATEPGVDKYIWSTRNATVGELSVLVSGDKVQALIGSVAELESTNDIMDSEVHVVFIEYVKSTETLTIYVDNVDGGTDAGVEGAWDTTIDKHAGVRVGDTTRSPTGSIQYVQVYSNTLTTEERAAIMADIHDFLGSVPPDPPDPPDPPEPPPWDGGIFEDGAFDEGETYWDTTYDVPGFEIVAAEMTIGAISVGQGGGIFSWFEQTLAGTYILNDTYTFDYEILQNTTNSERRLRLSTAGIFALQNGNHYMEVSHKTVGIHQITIKVDNPTAGIFKMGLEEGSGLFKLDNFKLVKNVTPPPPDDGVRAFPSAEGFARNATGGRDAAATLYYVNTTADNGNNGSPTSGSLRAALRASGKRVVLLDVGGAIDLQDEDILISSDDVTLYAHSRVQLTRGCLRWECENVVVRGIKNRTNIPRSQGDNWDCQKIENDNAVGDYNQAPDNLIFDHCSFQYASDEVFTCFYPTKRVTLQRSIIGPAIGSHNLGVLFDATGAGSLIYNLFAHNIDRNPIVKTYYNSDSYSTDWKAEVVNNVIYRFKWNYGLHVTGDYAVQIIEEGNYHKQKTGEYGSGDFGVSWGRIRSDTANDSEVYANDNMLYEGNSLRKHNTSPSDWTGMEDENGGANKSLTKPFTQENITPLSAVNAYNNVLSNVGSNYPDIDSLDQDIINQVTNGTGDFLSSDTPRTLPSLSSPPTFDDPENPTTIASNGYMNIENYRNALYGDIIPS